MNSTAWPLLVLGARIISYFSGVLIIVKDPLGTSSAGGKSGILNEYSMPQTHRPMSNQPASGRVRPVQDVATASRQAGQFPSVGMTLRSYQYDATDRNNRRGQPTRVVKGRWQRIKSKITLKRTVITVAVIALLIGGWVGGNLLWNAHKLFGGSILDVLKSTKLKGEDTGRVNILLAGNSADDPGHNGAELTDSIMILSLDTKHHKAFMLSVPRDLWIDDGYGHQKINGVYVDGQAEEFNEPGYPAGGMGQLEKVISENFGITFHYYGLVAYEALKQSVDAVGGIDVTVNSEDPRGLYDPNIDWSTRGPLVKLTNGKHHLDGREALNLARARGDAYNSYGFAASDFTRTENQRKLLIALKNRVASPSVIANPAKITSLADAIGNNVKTDFKTEELRRLYEIIKEIPSSNIQSLSLDDADGKNLLMSYATPQGQSALIPSAGLDDFSDIQAFINRHSSSDPVVQEGARLVVLNGTTVNGLASRIEKRLTAKKMIVDQVGDAGVTSQATTTIIDLSGGKKPGTKAALVKHFGNHVTSQNPYGATYEADFIIVLGADQTTSTTNTTADSSTE